MSDPEYDEYSRKVTEQMWNYLEFHVYDNWDIQMQDFLMKISIVDTFTIRLAEMITGANDAENLIEHARWMGNFLDEQMGANGEKIYKLRDHMRLSMLRRMNRKYTKEQIKNVYENAGLFYQLAGRPLQALEMYEKADSMERMVSILIDNARKSANSAYYYELKKYYLALSEEIVKKSPELMCGMSMLQSLLLNPEESERWYSELQAFADSHQGSIRKVAKNNLLYLEIGLSSDPENTSVYGISGEYNDEYYIPEFGNLQWADCVTRQAASNRAVGLFPATEEDVLWEIAIPSARISLGYVTNAAERQLLIQEDYQKKLAQGIAEAINEVYTNTQ